MTPFENLKAALEAGHNLILLARNGGPFVQVDDEAYQVMESELADLERVVESTTAKLDTIDSLLQIDTVREFVLGTSQAIMSRLLSGQSGQISVRLGVAESA